jgi:nucleotide-binding universal stress UspA family protein
LSGNVFSAAGPLRCAVPSILRRAIGPLALGALVILTQTAVSAGDSRSAHAASNPRLLAAAPAGATATTAPAATPAASAAGAIHAKAGGKPVVIFYDSTRWTGQNLGIAQAIAESAQDFATKFGQRFSVETTVVAGTGKGSTELDDAIKANGALLGTLYHGSAHGNPRRKTTEWSFSLEAKLRDNAGTPWIEAKKEADQEYPGLSDYHAITLSHLTELNDQVIDALGKEAAK